VIYSRLKSFVPLIGAALSAVVILGAILFVAVPQNAADWGTLLSAAVSIVALGALLTTLSLQREELSLQRIEIARLASATQEQSLHARRQTLIESYRGLDEKIDQVLTAPDFREIMRRAIDPNLIKYIIDEIRSSEVNVVSINLRGVQNIEKYKFITSYHLFPIRYSEDDGYGGDGRWAKAELPILTYITLSGITDAAGLVRHVYSLANELELLEYARSVMQRKEVAEPLLFIANEWNRYSTKKEFVFCKTNPLVDQSSVEEDIQFHIANKTRHYNLATSMISGARYKLDLFSPDAERAVNAEILKRYRRQADFNLDDVVRF
jgi:hypothetical protein